MEPNQGQLSISGAVAGSPAVSRLEQALPEYLRLRRSLGHDLAEAGWLLPGFVAFLDAHGATTVTIETALAWAQQASKSPTGMATPSGHGG